MPSRYEQQGYQCFEASADPPTLPSSHTASIAFSGSLEYAGTEAADFAAKRKRMDVDIQTPYPLGNTTYFYDFDALTVACYVHSDPMSGGAPSCRYCVQ